MGSNKVHLFFIKDLVILTQKINNTIVDILQQRYGNIGRKINSLCNMCAISTQWAVQGKELWESSSWEVGGILVEIYSHMGEANE